MRSVHCSVVVHRPVAEVYAYASDPDHLPRWASGLAHGEVRRDGDALVLDSPLGEVRVRFVAPNPYGVLDHEVVLPDGSVTLNPFRVLAHPEGSELLFTVRQGSMTDAELERDVATIEDDLETLRGLLDDAGPGSAG